MNDDTKTDVSENSEAKSETPPPEKVAERKRKAEGKTFDRNGTEKRG